MTWSVPPPSTIFAGEADPVAPRILEIADPCRADAALAHLDDPLDLPHLRGTPHCRGQAEPLAHDLVAPVDMGIDLQQRQRPASGKGLKHRYRHRDRRRRSPPAPRRARGWSRWYRGCGHGFGPDRPHHKRGRRDRRPRPFRREDRAAKVEIDMRHIGGIGGARQADGPWCRGAIGADRGIGGGSRCAEDGDWRVELGDTCGGQTEKGPGGLRPEQCGSVTLHSGFICCDSDPQGGKSTMVGMRW